MECPYCGSLHNPDAIDGDEEPWYTEKWYTEDLKNALEAQRLSYRRKPEKLRAGCRNILMISRRNEMLLDKAGNYLRRGEMSWKMPLRVNWERSIRLRKKTKRSRGGDTEAEGALRIRGSLVTEQCHECGAENTIEWNMAKQGYYAFCPNWDPMMLCWECVVDSGFVIGMKIRSLL